MRGDCLDQSPQSLGVTKYTEILLGVEIMHSPLLRTIKCIRFILSKVFIKLLLNMHVEIISNPISWAL